MAENIRTLEMVLKDSLDDFLFSRKEKREAKKLLSDLKLTKTEKQLLRGRIKSMASEFANAQNYLKILDWQSKSLNLLNENEKSLGASAEIYFSPGGSCREAICSSLRFARKRVRICVFTISDNRITAEVLAAQKRRITVQIITDDDKAFDTGSDIFQLQDAGIEVLTDQSPVHMHHKFALIDDETILTGSYNWTRSAAEYNYENLIVLKDDLAFRSYEQEFERLWRQLEL